MDRECNVELQKWENADNIDLPYILNDFEVYFEMRFLKKPVLVRKNPNAMSEEELQGPARRKVVQGGVLPKIPGSANNTKLPPTGSSKQSNSTKSSTNQLTPSGLKKIPTARQNSAGGEDFVIQGT